MKHDRLRQTARTDGGRRTGRARSKGPLNRGWTARDGSWGYLVTALISYFPVARDSWFSDTARSR